MGKNKSSNKTVATLSLLDILLVIFLVLKLTGLIDWSWWWVLAPLWIPGCIVIVVFFIIIGYILIRRWVKRL